MTWPSSAWSRLKQSVSELLETLSLSWLQKLDSTSSDRQTPSSAAPGLSQLSASKLNRFLQNQNESCYPTERWPQFSYENAMSWVDQYYSKWGDYPAAVLVLDNEVHSILASQVRFSYMIPKASFSEMKWMLSVSSGHQMPVLLHREVFPEQYSPNSAIAALGREHRLLPGRNETEALVHQTILEE